MMQPAHGWFAVEGVPMQLCHVLQRLHLGVDAVGSIIVSKGCFELFEDVVKVYKSLYLQYHNSSGLFFGFFSLDFLYFFSGRKQFEFDLDKKRVARFLKTNFWFPC